MAKKEEFEMESLDDDIVDANGPMRESDHYNWFRCEPLKLCQLFLQVDSAYQIVGELGEVGICQFRDLNNKVDASPWARKFLPELQRCNELEKRLGSF